MEEWSKDNYVAVRWAVSHPSEISYFRTLPELGPLDELQLPEWDSDSYLDSWMASYNTLTAPQGDRQFPAAPQRHTSIPSLSSSDTESTSSPLDLYDLSSEEEMSSPPSDLYDLSSDSDSYSDTWTWNDDVDSGYATATTPPPPLLRSPPPHPSLGAASPLRLPPPLGLPHPPALQSPPSPPPRAASQNSTSNNDNVNIYHNMEPVAGNNTQVPGPSGAMNGCIGAVGQDQDISRSESPINYVTNPAYSANADYNRFAADVAVRRVIQRRYNPTITVDLGNSPPAENPLLFYVSLHGWRNESPEAIALATHLCQGYGSLCDISSSHDNNNTTFFAGFASIEDSINCIEFFPRVIAGRNIVLRIADTCFLPATFLP